MTDRAGGSRGKKKSLCLTEALLGQPEGYPYLYPRNVTLYPESSWMIALLCTGRSSGSRFFLLTGLPDPFLFCQWRYRCLSAITAAGSAPDSHRVPCSAFAGTCAVVFFKLLLYPVCSEAAREISGKENCPGSVPGLHVRYVRTLSTHPRHPFTHFNPGETCRTGQQLKGENNGPTKQDTTYCIAINCHLLYII